MDAVKYIKEFNRMCRTYPYCSDGCPLKSRCILFRNPNADSESIEALVAAVEKWSKKHPVKTNLDRFKEVFPGSIEKMSTTPSGVFVTQEWWDAEYKEGEK